MLVWLWSVIYTKPPPTAATIFLGKNCVCVCVSLSSHLEDSLLDPGGYVLGDLHRRRIFSPFDESIEKQLPTLQPQVVRRRSLSNEFVRSFSAGIKWKVDNTWVMLELPLNQIKLWNWNMVKTIPQKIRVILLFLSDDTFQNRTFAARRRRSSSLNFLCLLDPTKALSIWRSNRRRISGVPHLQKKSKDVI